MKISYNWLRSYLDMSTAEGGVPSPQKLAQVLDASGIDVEGITELHAADGKVTEDDTVIDIRVSREMNDFTGMMWTANEVAGMLGIQIDDYQTYGELLPDDRWVRDMDGDPSLYVNSTTKRCRMLVGRVLGHVENLASPDFIRNAVVANGLESRGALYDIPAYTARNLGQPIYIVDRERLGTDTLVVEDAASEGTVTMGGVAYAYQPGDLVLTDGSRVIGIAGVVLDDSVAVTDATSQAIVFTAIYDADTVRAAINRLGVSNLNAEVAALGSNHASEMKAIGNVTSYLYMYAAGSAIEPLDIFTKYDFTKSIMDTTVAQLNSYLSANYTFAEIVEKVVNGKISAFVKEQVYDKDGNPVVVDVCEPSPHVGDQIHFGSKFGSYRSRREPCDLAQSILMFMGCDRIDSTSR